MVEEIEDPLDFIDNLLATPHPNGEKLWMYTQGKIVEGIEPDLIKRHLAMCPHCKKLAIRLGWPESDIKH